MSKASQNSPFKFLDSYGADDKAIFFGRDKEVEEVYDKVFQSKLLLVYGASGTGKSSIINCGLANQFNESDWFPIHIRRGGNIRRSLFNQIDKQAIQKVALSESEKMTNEGLQKVINSVYLDHFKPIYLIFDQFEELFIFGFKDEWKAFISSIRFLMDTDLDIHFIFIIRGEYLEFLSEFEELIPEFFDNRMRVEKMTRKKAEETIQGPAKEQAITIEDGFEEVLLKKLSPNKSHIELTFLQVFLDKIYRTAASDAQNEHIVFSKEQINELGQLGDVLAEFVDEQLFLMEDSKAALTVLKSFVSLQGTKVQNNVEDVVNYCRDLGNPLSEEEVDGIIRSFINKRILKDQDDNGKIELRHDSLAQKIFEKITNQEKELLDVKQFLSYSLNEYEKRGTLLSDEDIGYVSFYERNLELDSDMRDFINLSKKNSTKRLRERKTRKIVIAIILLLLVTSVFGLFYSQSQKARAEELAAIAALEMDKAENQKSIAEEQREIALRNEKAANRQAQIANKQKIIADQARNEADAQRNLALEQKSIAETERYLAERAKREAQVSENKALEQRDIADEQRSLALRLRKLSIAREIAIKSSYMANKELKALLSLQAYHFNMENEGNPFDPDIYQSLYRARKEYFGDRNKYSPHSAALKDIVVANDAVFTIGNDGKLTMYKNEVFSTVLESDYAFERLLYLDKDLLAIGSQNGSLVLFDLSTQTIRSEKQIHTNDITAVLLFQNSIVTSSLDGKITILSKDLEVLEGIDVGEKVNDMIAENGELWILSGSNKLSLIENGKIKSFTPVKGVALTALALDKASNDFYIGSQSGDIWVWNTETEQTEQVLSGHSSAITDIKIDLESGLMASSSLDRTVRIWPMDSKFSQPVVLNDHDNWAAVLSFNKGKLLSGSYSGSLRLYDLLLDSLTIGLCEAIGRSLTKQEWNEYIAEEITYQSVCNE